MECIVINLLTMLLNGEPATVIREECVTEIVQDMSGEIERNQTIFTDMRTNDNVQIIEYDGKNNIYIGERIWK